MRRCIELAQNGLGTTYPNPMVGAVIVHEGQIIGEGWHRKAGGPHAEVVAVDSVKDKTLLPQSTIYVSLEPCSHFGKTPPCCDLIITQNIPNVVVGTVDPNEKVAGRGIEKLRDAGKRVTVGVLERECRELNKRFFTFHHQKRPYVVLKWAQSVDGFIAPAHKNSRQPVWISNSYSQQLVHKWRTEEQAILAGTQTVVDDNPKLTARDWSGNQPVRIVIDKSNRIPKESHIFDNQAPTIVLTGTVGQAQNDAVKFVKIDFSSDVPRQIVNVLYDQGLQSVIVEGGAKTLQSFIDANCWDEARVFTGQTVLGQGIVAPTLERSVEKRHIGRDELLIFRNHDQHDYL